MIRCYRCQQPMACGHQCTGDECQRCGTLRMVIVEVVDARGSLSVQQPCARCKQQLTAATGLTAQTQPRSKKEL